MCAHRHADRWFLIAFSPHYIAKNNFLGFLYGLYERDALDKYKVFALQSFLFKHLLHLKDSTA